MPLLSSQNLEETQRNSSLKEKRISKALKKFT